MMTGCGDVAFVALFLNNILATAQTRTHLSMQSIDCGCVGGTNLITSGRLM